MNSIMWLVIDNSLLNQKLNVMPWKWFLKCSQVSQRPRLKLKRIEAAHNLRTTYVQVVTQLLVALGHPKNNDLKTQLEGYNIDIEQ